MHKALTSRFVTHLSGSCLVFFVKFVNQLDSCPSPWGISAPCNWLVPISDYYGTADPLRFSLCCNTPITGSQTFPNLYPCGCYQPLKPLGRYLTPGKSNRALNHSSHAVPDGYFSPPGMYGKTSRTCFFQFSPFRVPVTLTMLHSLHLRIAIGFGSPHHYYPCQPCGWFRFSGYDFTTLCTPHSLQTCGAQWSISSRTACGLTDRFRISPFRR